MPTLRDHPLPVRRFQAYSDIAVKPGSLILYGKSVEERSLAIEAWIERAAECSFAEVKATDVYRFEINGSGFGQSMMARDRRSQEEFWNAVDHEQVIIDITGLNHGVWAVLLKGAMRARKRLFVTYAEPRDYTKSKAPTEGQIYDLSEKIEGIRPIPGFAELAASPNGRVCIPLLGFEGTRFHHVLTVLEPEADRVIPIVGVPGFRIDYPFETYRGNRIPLLDSGAWKECRFAAANCPFSALLALEDIARVVDPALPIAVAPIGTKPHALGAILFYLTSPRAIEIVYDHPIRNRGRSVGATTVSLYNLTGLSPHDSKVA